MTVPSPGATRSLAVPLLALGLCGGPALRAQQAALPTPARVRVTASPLGTAPVIATVTARHADSLVLSIPARGPVTLPLAAVQRLDISRGTRAKTLTGAAVGFAAGTVATALFLAAFCHDPDTLCESDEYLRAFAIIALPPTAAGAIVGALVRVERWERVAPERFVRAGSGPPRFELGVRIPTPRVRRLLCLM